MIGTQSGITSFTQVCLSLSLAELAQTALSAPVVFNCKDSRIQGVRADLEKFPRGFWASSETETFFFACFWPFLASCLVDSDQIGTNILGPGGLSTSRRG